ncbi:GNAT family N-acetyltransferase [Pseudonocardia sp. HH130630-07]|uniref:GNAT family N-acetyltransferase n=1 Tax=Pseudonocardia sp. HH130630-07 TaxID=1690815 RepID=UPI0008152E37|nr:GNAT family N-acetyltransferase [Pseudonocardia sp. HH130630-07]ANY09127.1 hypothetical protein AFB00_25945 [Pseudonocardia sp. HH130630-07]
MSIDHDVRDLTDPADRRAAYAVFEGSLLRGSSSDEDWAAHGQAADEHWLGVYTADGEVAGCANSFPTRLTLPGGDRVPAAAVSAVGVRADATRAGRLSALMRAQLTAARDRGDVATVLHASESAIYGRFGYGVASRAERVRLTSRPDWRPEAPAGGRVRMLDRSAARQVLPALQERLAGARPAGMTATARWWDRLFSTGPTATGFLGTAVHRGPDGDDGFAVWSVAAGDPVRDEPEEIAVAQLWAATPAATAGLWRFLAGIDLAGAVRAWGRPLDEDLDLLLADPRRHKVLARTDDLWLRVVDVAAALGARTWGDARPVVLRLHDPVLGGSGTWSVGSGGARPAADAAPDIECSVASLAPAFLGDRAPSSLVAAGQWSEHTPGAAARADAVFAVPGPVPWCGTPF